MKYRLACDIGNTSLKLGLFGNERLLIKAVLDYEHWEQSLTETLEGFRTYGAWETSCIASVVPARNPFLFDQLEQIAGREPAFLSLSGKLPVQIGYATPETLGLDRVAAVLGAAYHYPGRPFILLDAGTATTLEVVNGKGLYLGGSIGPGPALQIAALSGGTAQLPEVSLLYPEQAIGDTTKRCIRSGVMLGFVGGVERLLRETIRELGEAPVLLATGGWAPLLVQQLQGFELRHHPDLVLEGIRHYMELNNL